MFQCDILYVAPAWWGLTTEADRTQSESCEGWGRQLICRKSLKVHLKRLWRLRCHCCVRLATARIMCYIRSTHRLLNGPMVGGLDPMNTNCLNVMIGILSIEYCSVCSGSNH